MGGLHNCCPSLPRTRWLLDGVPFYVRAYICIPISSVEASGSSHAFLLFYYLLFWCYRMLSDVTSRVRSFRNF
jgi:hypothetical protein